MTRSSAPDTSDDALLPRPPGVLRRWISAHPRLVDGWIVGCYLFGCALVVAFDLIANGVVDTLPDVDAEAAAVLGARSAYVGWPWALVSVLIVALIAVALAYRRRFPLPGVILVSVLFFFEQGLLIMPNSVALVVLLYAVPVYRSVREGWAAFAVAVPLSAVATQLTGGIGSGLIGPAGIALHEGPVDAGDQLIAGIANSLWLLVVLMIGINVGNRQRYVAALIDRARQLAREREQRAQLAVAAERTRIAREMHDIVAHSLSVVVTLNEAAKISMAEDPRAAAQALERSTETGRTALTEMRRLLGVLREEEREGSAAAPQPGLRELPELISGLAEAGLRVTFRQEGVPSGDASQQLAVYRIVQEGLTNALRHGGRETEVTLTLTHLPGRGSGGETRIEVTDAGPSQGGRGPVIPGSGRGLAGAEERARMFGGTLQAGPHEGGWRLIAIVPTGDGLNEGASAG